MRRLLILFLLACTPAAAQSFNLPNNNAGCPSGCRQITWNAGSDIWNGGSLPSPGGATCSPLNEDGSTDDTTNLNNCITAANAGTGAYSTCHGTGLGICAVLIPAGTVYVNGTVRLKSNVVLRGAQKQGNVPSSIYLPTADAGSTNIKLGASAFITTQNFSTSVHLSPTTSFAALPSTCALTGSPAKGDTTVTITSNSGACTVSTGSWIEVYGNDDLNLIRTNGTEGTYPPGDKCDWCGNNTGYYDMIQIVQITNLSGSTATLSRALYYAPYTTATTVPGGQNSPGNQNEPSGAKYTVITFPTSQAGFENMRFRGDTADIGASQILLLQGCLYCWVKNVETYVTGSSSESAHVEFMWSYGNEIRDSYFHDQRSGASGSGYGTYFQFANSDHKVENNIYRHNRHWIVFQGGGSGVAVLYNYADDGYTDDLTYLASGRTSHGAHPFMNLFEGNITSHIAADDFWGTTSHDVFWRNWIWGDETMNWALNGCAVCATTPGAPNTINIGYDPVDLYTSQSYYSYVGNTLGTSAIPTGANNACSITTTKANHATWSGATVSATCTVNNCGYSPPATPIVYSYGNGQLASVATLPLSSSTILRNGNYDYKTAGVAFWDSGSTNNTFVNSQYYGSKPSFFGNCAWPIAGYDLTPVAGLNPAEATWLGANVTIPVIPPPLPAPARTMLAGIFSLIGKVILQ